MILVIPRSGSNLLASLLNNSTRGNHTWEVVTSKVVTPNNLEFSEQTLENMNGLEKILPKIDYLCGDNLDLFKKYYKDTNWILCLRKDIVAQAVSLFKAMRTGSFTFASKIETNLMVEQDYDYQGILSSFEFLIRTNLYYDLLIEECNLYVLRVYYEDFKDIGMNRENVVLKCLNHLGIKLLQPAKDFCPYNLYVQRDEISKMFKARFKEDYIRKGV